MCWVYDESPVFYEECTPRAKKEHRCQECCRTIPIGARYQYCKGLFDGAFFTHKVCERCSRMIEATERVMKAAGCGKSPHNFETSTPPLGELWISLRELDLDIRRKIGRTYAYLLRRGWSLNIPE